MEARFVIPEHAKTIIKMLKNCEYEAYLVGGCVRDMLMNKTPKDYDICTNATPEEVMTIFRENYRIIETGIKHGTVTIYFGENDQYEVTTYRIDGDYSDGRHPDNVTWTKDLIEDLARRDFTMNAIALLPDYDYEHKYFEIIDPFHGSQDIENKIIRCVGDPDERFHEDGLRILRALRFAATYGFTIEDNTAKSIHWNYNLLENISAERIQSELNRLVCGENSYYPLHEFWDVITFIIPELKPALGCVQNNPFHCYDVYEHIIHSVQECKTKEYDVEIALLLHDLAKPKMKTTDENGIDHFHAHAYESAYISESILERLKYSKEDQINITALINYHDVRYGEVKRSTVRRMLRNLQTKKMFIKHMEMRKADIKAQSDKDRDIRLNKISKVLFVMESIIEENECFKMKDMEINGTVLMSALGLKQGPAVGALLGLLFEEVLEGQLVNKPAMLLARAYELNTNTISQIPEINMDKLEKEFKASVSNS